MTPPVDNKLESARALVAEEIGIDILTETQTLDNEKEMKAVARSFVCKFSANSFIVMSC